MFNKHFLIINKFKFTLKLHRRSYVSALFLTGDKAKENFAVLTPYMDFKEVFGNESEMKNNLLKRKMKINLTELTEKYKLYKSMENKEHLLEKQREEVASKLKRIMSKDENSEEVNRLKTEGKNLREELKQLKDKMFPIEEDFVDNFLKLPNKIHSKAHQSENTIFYQSDLPVTTINQSEIQAHTKYSDLIKFKNDSYYLFKEAAIFDTEFPFYCVNYFTERGFLQMSNPDFSRTVLLEAATEEAKCNVIDEELSENKVNQLHLVGGGSLSGFLGFIAKMAVFSSNLPLKLITSGRQYCLEENMKCSDLYTANQTNAVQVFCAVKHENESEKEMENVLKLVIDFYKKLDIHFRIIYSQAHEMLLSESLCARVQIFSPILSKYIDVGHISNYSNYISQRLLFNIRDKKVDKFPFIISGTVIDTAKLIACLLDNQKSLIVSGF